MIVVLDTNIWVSAFLTPHGVPGRIVTLVRLGVLQAVSTEKLWAELTRAVEYHRIRSPLMRDDLWGDTRRFLDAHPKVTFVSSVEPRANWVPEDTDDNWVIQCALTAKADRIISGDRDVRALKDVEGVRIVTPRELLDESGIVVE